MVSSPSPPHSHGCCLEKKHWWLTKQKIVDKYVKDARSLIVSQQQNNIASAINLLDAALAVSPRSEMALQLKATSLLHLRRFKEVAEMLHHYIPSIKAHDSSTSSSSSDNNSQPLSRERVKLLSAAANSDRSFTCFSVSDLKKKLMDGIARNRDQEGQWRYLVLGEACCHLGLMEDAMALLQTGKRLASAAFRRESVCWSDDSFISSGETFAISHQPQTTESDSICHLLSHIKLLLRRKTAAMAAAEAGLYSEAIRHFSKIVDSRRGSPQGFLAECYMHRAAAYRSSGRIAEAIADCNRTLALDPSCIEALTTRASLFETIHCLPDSLHDLEHLKLVYNSILRDGKLPGPAWKRQNVGYGEIPGKLRCMGRKIEELKGRVCSGEIGNVDYYGLMGLRRGCSRSELERAHLLLSLRHKPDKSTSFMDRCEFADEGEMDSIRDRAKMSGLLLYRLIERGYTSLMRIVMDEEASEKQRKRDSLQEAMQEQQQEQESSSCKLECVKKRNMEKKNVYQGVFCRDLAVVGSLLSQAGGGGGGGCNRPIGAIPIKYEALSC
ncbi:uncharacterized protein LOC112518614 [Cynara cardunculus var. scolymus]|uniref:DnaJ domain-containing protein n=1 Tax=Cynara cardunculus var. scolymus TaxID=59895 RepID=A0A103XPJ9_CYNCS|nr:uncharacterized protein LOC112518614 [Cynara cardunculus var. scolymus]KVH94490.1 DnaJ domain-containing protein [Cynara cardunculus var. scolymus]